MYSGSWRPDISLAALSDERSTFQRQWRIEVPMKKIGEIWPRQTLTDCVGDEDS
jgi:hypothetical protein